jgi:hypothetical protein
LDIVLSKVEIDRSARSIVAAPRPPAAALLLTELRMREAARELKCIHPFRKDFGSVAVIAPLLRQSRLTRCRRVDRRIS